MDNKFIDALIKKATGFTANESVEEYAPDKDDLKLLKRIIKTKQIPPDVSALKMLLNFSGGGNLNALSDGELEAEKRRLIKTLKESDKKEPDKNK